MTQSKDLIPWPQGIAAASSTSIDKAFFSNLLRQNLGFSIRATFGTRLGLWEGLMEVLAALIRQVGDSCSHLTGDKLCTK